MQLDNGKYEKILRDVFMWQLRGTTNSVQVEH